MNGRILGIDFGEKRVGFALSDPTQMLATAKEVVIVQNAAHAANEATRIAKESGAVKIVVGLPVNMDGTRGPAAVKATEFAELLKEKSGLPVVMVDERLTTKSAHDALMAGGMRNEERKKIVDKVAAQILLQAWLDMQAG